MKTLHMFHWNDSHTLDLHLPLISDDDSLVIYGAESQNNIEHIHQHMMHTQVNWYLVFQGSCPKMCSSCISHKQWLELIINHQNTLAWK